MELEEALELCLDGHAVLFTGAGFSREATNRLGQPLKSAVELANHLALLTGLPEGTSLDDAAEEFTILNGEGHLVEQLKAEFTATAVTVAHKQIASIPWRRIYTTNYDNVLENAYAEVDRDLRPVTLREEARLRGDDGVSETICVHFNGFIDRLTPETVGSELKLTDTSYLTASVSDSPWATMFRQDLDLARAVFFVGYSLADLDIRRLLFDSPRLKQKCFFVIGDGAEDPTKRRVSRFGATLPLNTSDFADLLASKSQEYSSQDSERHIGYSINHFSRPEIQPAFSDQSIFDLLLLGHLQTDLVWDSLHEGNPYFLERPATEWILTKLDSGSRIAVIHSELGNGKTNFLEGLKCRALEHGYDVYTVSVRSGDIFRELHQVLNSKDKTILCIDDYPDWMDIIEHFSLNAGANASLVLSARTAVHDVMIDRLTKAVGKESIFEYPADLLTPRDLEWIIDFFDRYGLWGEKAAWPTQRKMIYLADECRSQYSGILIKLFDSPQIASRFYLILERLNRKRDYYQVLLSIMILAVVQARPTINLMIDIWGSTVMETQFKKNDAVREVFDFQAGEVKLRSATAAQFILKRVADVNVTIDTLVLMAKAVDRAGQYSEIHRFLLRKLMQFSTLQTLLPEKQRRPATIRYYEGIKNLGGCRRNPQFWLQYAIACLTLGELDRAEKYFDTAYSFASRRNNSTFQIDNHYARFLLVRAVERDDSEHCMASFRKARTIIDEQIKDDRMHYPFRVARSYLSFYEAFESRLSRTRLDEIVQAAIFVSKRIESLPNERREERSVVECFDAMQRIITKGPPGESDPSLGTARKGTEPI